ncbi:DUF3927 domain-containing protein [Enterobacter hormaechei subsp. steigerwaltii]|nr:DUF3927 domain-containing protein [Enterobacter hormaechei]RTY43471.1 DUF3927 domain-containing protein [Enterobacter hormaechei subsp. steigerwaltii]
MIFIAYKFIEWHCTSMPQTRRIMKRQTGALQ